MLKVSGNRIGHYAIKDAGITSNVSTEGLRFLGGAYLHPWQNPTAYPITSIL